MPTITIDIDNLAQVSDGYHTLDELYEHRCLLFINLCLSRQGSARWKIDPKTHREGAFSGWFLLYLELPTGQISYHIPNYMHHFVRDAIVQDDDYEWDGHDANETLLRLELSAKEMGKKG